MKTCTKCLEGKPESDFYKDSRKSSGLMSACKLCHALMVQKYQGTAKGVEALRVATAKYSQTSKAKERDARYYASEKGLAKGRRNSLRQKELHPTKVTARYRVKAAIKSGKLVRGSCEICGDTKAEGHHDNYEKPLEVRWLCKHHHVEFHKLLNEKV